MSTAIAERANNLPAVIDEGHPKPSAIIGLAAEMATALSDIVEKRQLFKVIGGRKHLLAEAWQTVAALDLAHMITEWVRPVVEDGKVVAYEARVVIQKHGETIGAGEMSCGLEEFPCRGKQGHGKDRAAKSAAQTWAGAKAGRMKYAWVVVLAGYEPTPAEEMRGTESEQEETKPSAKKEEGKKPPPIVERMNKARAMIPRMTNIDSINKQMADIQNSPDFAEEDRAELVALYKARIEAILPCTIETCERADELVKTVGWDQSTLNNFCLQRYKVAESKNLSEGQARDLCGYLMQVQPAGKSVLDEKPTSDDVL